MSLDKVIQFANPRAVQALHNWLATEPTLSELEAKNFEHLLKHGWLLTPECPSVTFYTQIDGTGWTQFSYFVTVANTEPSLEGGTLIPQLIQDEWINYFNVSRFNFTASDVTEHEEWIQVGNGYQTKGYIGLNLYWLEQLVPSSPIKLAVSDASALRRQLDPTNYLPEEDFILEY